MRLVLLDRDGTVIKDPKDETIEKIEKLELFPDTLASFRYLADNGFSVIFVTNQKAIEEGRMTEEEFWRVHEELLRRLKPSGAKILKTYMNGEAPGPNASPWRKPGPKMLLQAAEDFNFNLAEVYMVGDSQTDVEAAVNAGCKGGILVETATSRKVVSPEAVYTATHLLDAVHYIVANS